MTAQVGLGPFGGYYAGDRIVVCTKYGSYKAAVVGWAEQPGGFVMLHCDQAWFNSHEAAISLQELAHRAYGEVVLPDTKES